MYEGIDLLRIALCIGIKIRIWPCFFIRERSVFLFLRAHWITLCFIDQFDEEIVNRSITESCEKTSFSYVWQVYSDAMSYNYAFNYSFQRTNCYFLITTMWNPQSVLIFLQMGMHDSRSLHDDWVDATFWQLMVIIQSRSVLFQMDCSRKYSFLQR